MFMKKLILPFIAALLLLTTSVGAHTVIVRYPAKRVVVVQARPKVIVAPRPYIRPLAVIAPRPVIVMRPAPIFLRPVIRPKMVVMRR